jgi:hypothetical protein
VTISQLFFHLRVVAFAGTAKHLRYVHHLPEALIDTEDRTGLHVDHAFLHGYVLTADGRLVATTMASVDE